MSDGKPTKRLSIVARELNVAVPTIIQFLGEKGYTVENNPNTKLSEECIGLLEVKFRESKSLNEKAIKNIGIAQETKKTTIQNEEVAKTKVLEKEEIKEVKIEKEVKQKPVETEKPEQKPDDIIDNDRDFEDFENTNETTVEPTLDLSNETDTKLTFKNHEIIPIDAEDMVEFADGEGPKVLGKINLEGINSITRPKRKTKEEKVAEKKQKEQEIKASKEEQKRKFKEQRQNKFKEQKTNKTLPPQAKTNTKPNNASTNKVNVEKKVEHKEKIEPAKIEKIEKPIKEEPKIEFIPTKVEKLTGPNVVGKIDIENHLKRQQESEKKKQLAKEERQKNIEKEKKERREKRKRIEQVKVNINQPTTEGGPNKGGFKNYKDNKDNKDKDYRKDKTGGNFNNNNNNNKQNTNNNNNNANNNKFRGKPLGFKPPRHEVNEEDVQKQVKETLARLTSPKQKSKTSQYRREKRDIVSQKREAEYQKQEAEKNILKVTEFVTVNEIATMMNVPVNNLIGTFLSLGLFVSINQRLDAETMSIVADEYGYQVEFVSAEVLNEIQEEEDIAENLEHRPPIVTVMGHVDHGKTKLLDQIRNTNVIAGEAGGITQHIGAYSVQLENGRQITFLDTPGHEAFTAMRARGAQITDVAIIVIAADDSIMPQTVEAINHASAAGVPIVFAINKIDKPTANPEKIREALAGMNYLVEEWGGKYQSQEISAKQGINIEELLEKVILESDILDLKANPNRNASGTIIESTLDKGRGYVATLLIQNGTLKVGDILLAGCQTGRVKAMYNERGQKIEKASPSTPVLVLGLNGAPQAGDKFNVMDSDAEARNIANKRTQLQRELGLRTQKHITLDEIGRRLSLGNFNEINIIVKGDVDGSIEALSDSLIKLSTENFAVNIIHKAVGQISESDVMLATASNAIIVGFQVRPSSGARKLAEREEIEIRLYSIIYDAINEIRDAMEGMLKPTIKEHISGTAEIRETFKIGKVGTIAGCFVIDGKILRKSKVRVIRDGIVIYTGELGSLKRFKDEVKEVATGLECGINIEKFNDIKAGDIVEAFEETEEKGTL